MDPLSRRRLLQAGFAVTFLPSLLGRRAALGAAAPPIHPRADWGADLPPRGPLEAEQAGDVRLLLVHHSVSVNDYPPEAVPEELRSFFRLHTAPEKGWADIAYNFLVDRFGGIWEGRAGSLEAPVKGDATGGSQGFAVLCCFIGDHRTVAPSPAAQASMVALLAWLAERYGIDPRPGTMASFTSRGSNRWPAGTPVTTTTIAGHRDMSKTVCPGDAAYHLVRNDFPSRVAAAMGLAAAPQAAPTTTPATSASTTSAPATTAPAPATTAPAPTSDPTTVAAPLTTARPVATAPATAKEGPGSLLPVGAAVAGGLGALVLVLRRRLGRSES
ncbi:MAG: N-acetylmuramoyl-L-alanine amidase [Acidimicrobiia bacterium]